MSVFFIIHVHVLFFIDFLTLRLLQQPIHFYHSFVSYSPFSCFHVRFLMPYKLLSSFSSPTSSSPAQSNCELPTNRPLRKPARNTATNTDSLIHCTHNLKLRGRPTLWLCGGCCVVAPWSSRLPRTTFSASAFLSVTSKLSLCRDLLALPRSLLVGCGWLAASSPSCATLASVTCSVGKSDPLPP